MGWRLRSLWRELMTPDDFEGRPYGGLLNQWGHYSAAAAVFLLIAGGFHMIAGEMPYKLPVAVAVVLLYVLLLEWAMQGWQGRDSFEDSTFVALGISTVALSVEEVAAQGRFSIIAVDVPMLLIHLVGVCLAVLYYTLKRVIR